MRADGIKVGDLLWGPRQFMERDFALAYPYAAMSHETIPAITTRIEYWATSLLNSAREISESGTCSPNFLSVVSHETTLSSAIQPSALPAWRTGCAVG